MIRFLTPAKIALLALTQLYAEGVVPTSESTSVLSFFISRLYPDHRRSVATSTDSLDQPGLTSDFGTSLSKHDSSIPGRTTYDLLLKRLWMIDCLDGLDAFITTLPQLLSKSREQLLRERESGEVSESNVGHILRTSPMGILIRRSHLEFTKLQFQDNISLWQDFVAYRLPSRALYEKKNPPDNQNALDLNLSSLAIDSMHPLAQIMYGRLGDHAVQQRSSVSYDVEHLFEFQVSEMQRLGVRLSDGMRQKLAEMARLGQPIPKVAYYLKFLDAWRAGDYSTSYDSLHRYFDYTMQSRDRTFYQYALLNLAILQADFGCYEQAIPAMQEAIATARENKDTTCLNFCMSWLYHFGRSASSEMKTIRENGILGSEMDGLTFLRSRAKDAEMWSLLSTTLLSESKLVLQRGDNLAAVFENITKAGHLNIVKQVPNATGPTLLMKGTAFGRSGITHLAWSCGECFLQCHTSDAPIEDVLKSTCRLAAICSQRGRYKEATEFMESVPADTLRVLKYYNYWKFFNDILMLKRFIYHNKHDQVTYLLHQLKDQGPPDQELEILLSILEVVFLIRSSDLRGAHDLLDELAGKPELAGSDVLVQCRLMMIKARILAASGRPLKTFTIVMRAAQLAYRARLLPALWEAICLLCNILNELSEFARAEELLHAVIPQILECQDCELTAQAYSCLADAMVGMAGKEAARSNKRKEYISNAMECIDSSYEQLRHLEDVKGQMEMLAKKAMILKWRGDNVLASDVTSQYVELKKHSKMVNV